MRDDHQFTIPAWLTDPDHQVWATLVVGIAAAGALLAAPSTGIATAALCVMIAVTLNMARLSRHADDDEDGGGGVRL